MIKKIVANVIFLLGLLASLPANRDFTYLPHVYAAEYQSVGANSMISAASIVIRQRAGVPADTEDLVLAVLGSPSDLSVPAGNVDLSVNLPYGVRYNVPTTAAVTIRVNGVVAAVQTLKFQVKLNQQVVVAARPIMRGEVFSTENLRLERMDVGRLSSGYYTDINQLAGLLGRRSISSGTALNKYMVEPPLIIERGKAVKIIARAGGIEVSAAGKALQDGYAGQIIRVQNVNSYKYVNAKVIDSATVEVIL